MVRKVCLKQMEEKPAGQAETLAPVCSNLATLEFLAKQGHPVPGLRDFQKFFAE